MKRQGVNEDRLDHKRTRPRQDGETSTEVMQQGADSHHVAETSALLQAKQDAQRAALMDRCEQAKQRAELCDTTKYNKVMAAVKVAEQYLKVARECKYLTSEMRREDEKSLRNMQRQCDKHAEMCCVFDIVAANLLQTDTVNEFTMTPQAIAEAYTQQRSSLSPHYQNVLDNDDQKRRRYIITHSCNVHNIDLPQRCSPKVGGTYLDLCHLWTFMSRECKRGAIRTIETWKPFRCCEYGTRLIWRGIHPFESSCEYYGAFAMLISPKQALAEHTQVMFDQFFS